MTSMLIIAGHEANGMAGLVKDLNVCNALRIKPMSVVTQITAQTQTKLCATQTAQWDTLRSQLHSLEHAPSVVKIGLLGSRWLAMEIAAWLKTLDVEPWVILDPVETSSSNGSQFSHESLLEQIEPLLPIVDLLTPNLEELNSLLEGEPQSNDAQRVHQFYTQNPQFGGSILLTGGHHPEAAPWVTDTLFEHSDLAFLPKASESNDANSELSFKPSWQQPRVVKRMRGTGCVLSTAIGCALVEHYPLLDAITLGNAFLASFRASECMTMPTHWPMTQANYPVLSHSANRPISLAEPFLPLAIRRGLYPIVDSADWLLTVAKQGVRTVQLRIKASDESHLREQIARAVRIAQRFSLQLFINDHWQLAIEYGAYGVHLGQEDIIEADLTAIAAAGLRLGVSTHGDFEFLIAKQIRPSYLAVGAIFPTQTKDMTGKIQGLERLKRYCKLAGNIPVVAIGGITLANVDSVLETETPMVAVVSAITQSSNPQRVIRAFNEAMEQSNDASSSIAEMEEIP